MIPLYLDVYIYILKFPLNIVFYFFFIIEKCIGLYSVFYNLKMYCMFYISKQFKIEHKTSK